MSKINTVNLRGRDVSKRQTYKSKANRIALLNHSLHNCQEVNHYILQIHHILNSFWRSSFFHYCIELSWTFAGSHSNQNRGSTSLTETKVLRENKMNVFYIIL